MPATAGVITGISGLLGAGSLAAQVFGPKPKAPTMPSPPPPATSPIGTPGGTGRGPGGPSFLAAAAAPPSQSQQGGKSLLGQ